MSSHQAATNTLEPSLTRLGRLLMTTLHPLWAHWHLPQPILFSTTSCDRHWFCFSCSAGVLGICFSPALYDKKVIDLDESAPAPRAQYLGNLTGTHDTTHASRHLAHSKNGVNITKSIGNRGNTALSRDALRMLQFSFVRGKSPRTNWPLRYVLAAELL
jgi:hypothetical protein